MKPTNCYGNFSQNVTSKYIFTLSVFSEVFIHWFGMARLEVRMRNRSFIIVATVVALFVKPLNLVILCPCCVTKCVPHVQHDFFFLVNPIILLICGVISFVAVGIF